MTCLLLIGRPKEASRTDSLALNLEISSAGVGKPVQRMVSQGNTKCTWCRREKGLNVQSHFPHADRRKSLRRASFAQSTSSQGFG